MDRPSIPFKNRFLPLLASLFLIAFSSVLNAAVDQKLSPLFPYKSDEPPKIDGILDDPVWQKAPTETGFQTYHPDYGKQMVENTIVYYAYDRENLYFAFRCFDSQPKKIKASINARDKIRPDDWICINLDSFNDQQGLYALYVNPVGIQADSRFEGGDEDFTVDIVWFSAGRIDKEGYTIEIKVPFKSIRLSEKEPVEMGVIFERMINRRSEAGTYPPLDPAHGPNFLTQTRPLILRDIKHYKLIEVLPAVTYSHTREESYGRLRSLGDKSNLSLTAKYGITSRLILDGAVNPDFSQVESDAGQVDFNLRYALFYPEKRPFFLEGLEKFNFGAFDQSDPLLEVVHTRTIINPLLGFKLNGKIGDKNTVASIYALDDLPDSAGEDYAHFGIFRYKRALANDGFIGGFYTGRERKNGFNRVLGSDGQFRLNPSSMFAYHFFYSQTKPHQGAKTDSGHILGLHYGYLTRDWIVMLGMQDVAENFQTETGYLTRTGLTRFRSGFMRMIYPKSSFIFRIDPMIHSFHIRDKFSDLYETYNAFDVRFILGQNSWVMLGGRYATEIFLAERFDTSGFRSVSIVQFTKRFSIDLRYTYQNKIRYVRKPYQGRGHDASLALEYLPSENLHLNLSLVYSDFTRDFDSEKEYDYTIIRSRNVFQVNKYLFFRGIVEYNSFWKRLMTDFLASFTYIPGTVIHVGYGSLYEKIEWADGTYRQTNQFLETKRGFFFKASILWRR